jgi:hypothetical protein
MVVKTLVNIENNKSPCTTLLDTGSHISLIKEQWAEVLPSQNAKLTQADGLEIRHVKKIKEKFTIEDEELKTTKMMHTCPELEFDVILGVDACRELDYVGQRGQPGEIKTRIGDLKKFLTEKKGINDRMEDNCIIRIEKEGVWKRYKSKKLSREEKEALDDYLTEMTEEEFIKRVNTPTSSNIIMVRKPDNTFRVCVDYRYLNGITVEDVYPMPDVSSILERMAGYKIYSKIDPKNTYYNVRMSEESQALT